MWSPGVIDDLNREAARKAARAKRYPLVVEQADLDRWQAAVAAGTMPDCQFPYIGEWRPRGYRAGRDLFVDAGRSIPVIHHNLRTGQSQVTDVIQPNLTDSGGPALSIAAFIKELKVGKAYAVTSSGQFQVYVTEFDPPKRR